MTAPPPGWLDRAAARRALARATRDAPVRDPLAEEIGRRMAERLDYIRLAPRRVLEVRRSPGEGGDLLRRRYPRAEHVALDPIPPASRAAAPVRWVARLARPLRRRGTHVLCGSGARLPLAASRFTLVWSNLALAAYDDPAATLREWHRVLEVGGLLMFTTLGPDTLKELRAAFVPNGFPHVHPFADMHDVGDMLVGAGFAEPVIDMEMVTLTYASIAGLLDDLRRAGATNAHAARWRGLTGRGTWERARSAYADLTRDGRVPATVEIVYGHAWKPAPRTTADGGHIVRFDARTPTRKAD